MYGMGMGMGGGGARKTFQLDQSYNFPVVAMNDLTEYQPHDYTFALSQRVLFDVSKIDKSIKVLNGDIARTWQRPRPRPSSTSCSPRRPTSSTT